MIDYFISQTLICTFLLGFLLLASTKLNTWLGAKNTYVLWLCVPLTLSVSTVVGGFGQDPLNEMLKYSVFAFSRLPSLQPTWSVTMQTSLIAIWGIVALCVLAYFIFQHLKYLAQLSILPSEKSFRGLRLCNSCFSISPQLVGLINPKIIVPIDFEEQFSASQQALILRHEYCHWQQKDPIWNMLGVVILSVFWFNPLFWYAFWQFKLQQELACDARVLNSESVAVRKEYALSMVSVSANTGAFHFTQNLYSEKYNMKNRIQQIMRHKKRSISPSILVVIGLLLTSSASYAWLNTGAHKADTPVHPIKRVSPKYPVQAAADNIQGWVQLSFNIETDGSVSDVAVIDAAPKWTFEKVAIDAVRQWQYQPSNATQLDMKVQLDFRMDDSADLPEYQGIEVVEVAK